MSTHENAWRWKWGGISRQRTSLPCWQGRSRHVVRLNTFAQTTARNSSHGRCVDGLNERASRRHTLRRELRGRTPPSRPSTESYATSCSTVKSSRRWRKPGFSRRSIAATTTTSGHIRVWTTCHRPHTLRSVPPPAPLRVASGGTEPSPHNPSDSHGDWTRERGHLSGAQSSARKQAARIQDQKVRLAMLESATTKLVRGLMATLTP